jgi:hypothetical protein
LIHQVDHGVRLGHAITSGEGSQWNAGRDDDTMAFLGADDAPVVHNDGTIGRGILGKEFPWGRGIVHRDILPALDRSEKRTGLGSSSSPFGRAGPIADNGP